MATLPLPFKPPLLSLGKKDHRPYGPRLDHPEWAAAEFVRQFRLPTNWNGVQESIGGEPLHDGTIKPYLGCYRVNVYVTQHVHQDIEYLYRVECPPEKWVVRIYTPTYDARHDIVGFEETHSWLYRSKRAGLSYSLPYRTKIGFRDSVIADGQKVPRALAPQGRARYRSLFCTDYFTTQSFEHP